MIVNLSEPVYSYDKLISDAGALAERFHTLVQYVTIGRSHDNRDILLLKLGNGRKHILFCAGVHGRESINTIVLMKLIEYYAELYVNYQDNRQNTSQDKRDGLLYTGNHLSPLPLGEQYKQNIFEKCVYELLNTFTILFLPLLNPDGYMIAMTGFQSIRDGTIREAAEGKGTGYESWKYNARGIDINRNFPSKLWKPKEPGDYAASENETKALIYVFHHYRIKGFIDLHSRGNEIYYYRSTMSQIYNDRQLRIATRLKEITGYGLVPPEEEVDPGDSGGNTVHYFSEHFYQLALTIETVEEEADFPLDNHCRQIVFDDLKLVVFELGSLII